MPLTTTGGDDLRQTAGLGIMKTLLRQKQLV